jgi:hypothetical protein
MAIDTTAKALNLAVDFVAQAGALMDAIRKLAALAEETQQAGIDFTPGGEPMDFSNASQVLGRKVELGQTDGQGILDVITSGVAVKTFLDQQFHSTNFDKVRP